MDSPLGMLCNYFGWNYKVVSSAVVITVTILSLLLEYLTNKKENKYGHNNFLCDKQSLYDCLS